MIETLVSSRGYLVESVTSGAKAIDVATLTPPGLVLLDLMLPGEFDGFEVCRRLRAETATAEVPIIVISARDDTTSRQRAADAGATAYYTKPFSPMALLREIDRIREVAATSTRTP